MKKKAFQAAFPNTIPIAVGFLFPGMSYGFLMQSKGFSVFYPMLMSLFIFAGSMEFPCWTGIKTWAGKSFILFTGCVMSPLPSIAV